MGNDSRSREAAPCVVVGAGPAGLMAAETLARAGRRVVLYDASAESGAQVPARRARRPQPHPCRADRDVPDALWRGGRAPASGDRGFPAVGLCATGRRSSEKTPSSARAGGCSRRASRRRRCCAPGSAGSTNSASRSGRATASLASASDGRAALRDSRRARRASSRAQLVLALGGASWPRLGADGGWVEPFRAGGNRGRAAEAGQLRLRRRLVAANSRGRFAGAPLNPIALSHRAARACAARRSSTATGIEGGAVYALSAALARRRSQPKALPRSPSTSSRT